MNISKDAKKAVEKADWNPLRLLSNAGIRSGHAYAAGFIAVGLSAATWLLSRGKNDSRSQSDRWGLFVGEWAPTFFALGVGLKLEEKK